MPPALAAPLFIVSLLVTLAAARLFARRLDRLGVRFGFPEALIGLLTALAADGPEISSALYALIKGANDVGVGVLVGSNGFNLAAMIGLSGVLTGRVRLPRGALLLEGTVGLLITIVAGVLLLGWLSPQAATAGSALVLIPYLVFVVVGARLLDRPASGAPERSPDPLPDPPSDPSPNPPSDPSPNPPSDPSANPTHHLLALIVLDVALIIAGSAGMVQTALTLARDWHVSGPILGVLILGPLTSIPNAATAVRLGVAGRGAALVGETFNSNTINLAAGVVVPSLFVTLAAVSALAKLQLAWLLAATLLTLFMLGRPGGIGRTGAVALIVLYFAFVGGTLVGS